jgi:hypothetical protein
MLENIGKVLCILEFCLLVVRFEHCAHSEPLECLSLFDMYMSYRPVISYDLAHRTDTVPSSWRHTMNKKQKLSSVAHLIIVSC